MYEARIKFYNLITTTYVSFFPGATSFINMD